MANPNAKVFKITRTVYVLVDEAQDEADAWRSYFTNCDAELHKDSDIVEEGTNASFGQNLGWDDDE